MPKTQKSTIENWLIGRLNAETNDSLLSQKYDLILYFSMTYNLFESVVFDCDAKIKDIEDKASFFYRKIVIALKFANSIPDINPIKKR